MVNTNITLEDSKGHIIQNPTEDQIRTTINKIGNEIDYCILTMGNTFIQTAGSKNGLMIQVNDGSVVKEADRADFSPEEVCRAFLGFLHKNGSWKEQYSLGPLPASVNTSGGQTSAKQMNKQQFDVKDEVVKALKSEGMYKTRRLIRRGIGLITGLIFKKKIIK